MHAANHRSTHRSDNRRSETAAATSGGSSRDTAASGSGVESVQQGVKADNVTAGVTDTSAAVAVRASRLQIAEEPRPSAKESGGEVRAWEESCGWDILVADCVDPGGMLRQVSVLIG